MYSNAKKLRLIIITNKEVCESKVVVISDICEGGKFHEREDSRISNCCRRSRLRHMTNLKKSKPSIFILFNILHVLKQEKIPT